MEQFKIFKDHNKNLLKVPCEADKSYYDLIFEQRKNGYEQFLLTNDLLLRLMLTLISEEDSEVSVSEDEQGDFNKVTIRYNNSVLAIESNGMLTTENVSTDDLDNFLQLVHDVWFIA